MQSSLMTWTMKQGLFFEKKVGDSVQKEKLLQKFIQMEKFLLN